MTSNTDFQTNIPTGFPKLDEMTGGLQRGDLVIIAGYKRTSGKTTFANSLARNIADGGCGVAYFSLVLPLEKLYWKMATEELTPCSRNETKLENARKKSKLLDAPIYVDDTKALSVTKFREKCLTLAQNNNVKVVIIDFLQLMKQSVDNHKQEMEYILRSLKEIANELNIAIVALSHHYFPCIYNKKRPKLSSLLDKCITQYADIVAFLYGKIIKSYDAMVYEIIIAKNRNGILGDMLLKSNSYSCDDDEIIEKISQFIDEKREDVNQYLDMDLENLSVEQLEEVILRLYYKHELTKAVKEKLDDALSKRKYKINQAFEWTHEKKEKFLRLNQKFLECWEKMDAEALQTLKNRANETDDFEVDVNVLSFIHVADEYGDDWEAEDCIEEVLIDLLPEIEWVNHYSYDFSKLEPSSDITYYIDREHNCNFKNYLRGNFDEHFISSAMYDLFVYSKLSFPDILKINRLRGELRIAHKYNVVVECKEYKTGEEFHQAFECEPLKVKSKWN